MNARQLVKLGVPQECVGQAITCVQEIVGWNHSVPKNKRIDVKEAIHSCVANPKSHKDDQFVGSLAKAIIVDQSFERPEPITYKTWGTDIDQGSHDQMRQACSIPMAVGAALMPDAHVGYGLPIGGVLALDNAVVPFAVGVDIACRMKMTIYDVLPESLDKQRELFKESLKKGTVFGVGKGQKITVDHPVMYEDWNVTKITAAKKDLARSQLGSSGSGNHFVEWGVITVVENDVRGKYAPLKPGSYIALMSHSGSRNVGAAVCKEYSSVAQKKLNPKFRDLGRLAWLSMDSDEGREYWAAMELMGLYASANHDIIHRKVAKIVGIKPVADIENHHNFAFKEKHKGKEVIVHRKGATPAGEGVLGVIPGSMADPAYVVRGLGNSDSLNSASHGAGRKMSRKKGKEKFSWNATKHNLAARGITVLGGAADEVPGVYKNINDVMLQQADLVEIVAKFEPKIVMMCGDGSKAED
jgi:tRNA-splicing ligase RtcB (3'-phosphate/5'-hydroxy nucleic acid ligase)